jgi:hypothetical protein
MKLLGSKGPGLSAVLLLIAIAPGWRAAAGKLDTLSGLTPGDLIGCNYTFQNGDPSIPCAKDTVGADGTVSFLKPDAPFDNIEYFDITTGKDIVGLIDPPGTPINAVLADGDQYPIFQSAGSFFDVFVDIDLNSFDNAGLELPGAISVGDTFDFTNGTSAGIPDVTISGFTGTAEVVGFDVVSPEPGTLLLFATGCAGLLRWRRRQTHR